MDQGSVGAMKTAGHEIIVHPEHGLGVHNCNDLITVC